MERKEKVLKKLIVMYIQNDQTLRYITHVLNIFNTFSFSNVELTYCYLFILKILIILT